MVGGVTGRSEMVKRQSGRLAKDFGRRRRRFIHEKRKTRP